MNCEICGEEISGGSVFTCNYCGGVFCPRHRLPFNHACKNLAEWKKSGTPENKRTRTHKKVSPTGMVLVKKNKKLIITGVVIIALVVLFGLYFMK